MCDRKAKDVGINAANKEDNNTMRCYGEKVIMKAGQIASMRVKELMREVDAEEEEGDYVMGKFKDRVNVVEKWQELMSRKHYCRH